MTEIRTSYWAKPIPQRQFDWEAVYDNYEGGDPIGYGRTEQQAIDDLVLNYPVSSRRKMTQKPDSERAPLTSKATARS